MNDYAKRIEAECAMIAQVNEEAAKLWRAYIMLGLAGFRSKAWKKGTDSFIYYGLVWTRTKEGPGYWRVIDRKLTDLYSWDYSYKDYDQHKTENRQRM